VTKLVASDLNARFAAICLQNKLDASDREPFALLGNENRPIFCDRAAGEPIVECGVWYFNELLPVDFPSHWLYHAMPATWAWVKKNTLSLHTFYN
jgi:hypothetical protein